MSSAFTGALFVFFVGGAGEPESTLCTSPTSGVDSTLTSVCDFRFLDDPLALATCTMAFLSLTTFGFVDRSSAGTYGTCSGNDGVESTSIAWDAAVSPSRSISSADALSSVLTAVSSDCLTEKSFKIRLSLLSLSSSYVKLIQQISDSRHQSNPLLHEDSHYQMAASRLFVVAD
jgi:hypothetical protein